MLRCYLHLAPSSSGPGYLVLIQKIAGSNPAGVTTSMNNPFTIRIFVPEGDPEGIRIIDRLSSTGIFYAFPRNKWPSIKHRPELKGAGIYILSGYSDAEDELPTVYVGQADTIVNRLEQHIKSKDYWDKAVVFVS